MDSPSVAPAQLPVLLALETSGPCCSVALRRTDGAVLTRESHEGNDHAVRLTPLVEELLAEAQLEPSALGAVAVSSGPGSYTGLRIGYATAKGLAFGLGVPLLAIPTLQVVAAAMLRLCGTQFAKDGLVLYPMTDARREEVYTQAFDAELRPLSEPMSHVLGSEPLAEHGATRIVYGGSGAQKAARYVDAQRWELLEGVEPAALDMIALATDKYNSESYEDVAYCEPLYLKEFIAGAPRPTVLDAARAAHPRSGSSLGPDAPRVD